MTYPKPERMTDLAFEDLVTATAHNQQGSFERLAREARRAREREEKAQRDMAHWKMELAEARRERDEARVELKRIKSAEGFGLLWRETQATQLENTCLRAERDALRKALERYTVGHVFCRCTACTALSEPDVYSKPSTVNHPARCFCGEPAYHEGACIPDVREPRVDPFDRPGEGET